MDLVADTYGRFLCLPFTRFRGIVGLRGFLTTRAVRSASMAPVSFDASRAVLDGAVDDRRLFRARELGARVELPRLG